MLPDSRLAGLSRFSLSISHSARFVVVTLQFAVHDCGQLICAADGVVQLPLGLLLAALCLQTGSVTAAVALFSASALLQRQVASCRRHVGLRWVGCSQVGDSVGLCHVGHPVAPFSSVHVYTCTQMLC